VAKDYQLEKWITPEISDGQLSVCWIDSLDASLFLTSEGIFWDFRDCQFPSQRPDQASINDSHEAIGHFVWNSMFDL
jgi:hypothetical protein